jgi:hypothetical protein
VDNIKMCLKEIRRVGESYINIAEDKFQWWAVVSKAVDLPVP